MPICKLLSTGSKITAKVSGVEFMQAVEAHLARLAVFPLLAPVYHGKIRRRVMHRFPYGVFYESHPTRIIVMAVLDLRQDPEHIRRRLE